MLLQGHLGSIPEFGIYILVLIIALTIHEFAHAYVAHLLGDDTAKLMGRMTLNPLAHLDLMGSIFLLVAGFGWGKPVQIQVRNLADPRIDQLTVALAGPVSNFLLAIVLGLVIRFFQLTPIWENTLVIGVFLNLTLMIFNLLPIPPLDGSKFLRLFMSDTAFMQFERYGQMILLILIVFSSSIPVIPFIITKVVGFFFTMITGFNFNLS